MPNETTDHDERPAIVDRRGEASQPQESALNHGCGMLRPQEAIIQPSQVADIASIAALIQENTFRVDGSGALLLVSPQQILRVIGDEEMGRFLSAVMTNGEIAGCVSVAVYGAPSNYVEVLELLRGKLPLEDFGITKETPEPPRSLVAELRSLVVSERHRGHQLGLRLIEAAKAEARARGFSELYSLTNQRVLPLFERAGFHRARRTPQKLLMDCAVCPILDRCNEVPVVAKL